MITYQPETGTPTSVPAPPWADPYLLGHRQDQGYRLEALLVPDGSQSGYATFPATLGPDFSFSVPDVPSGSYFLTLSYDCILGDPSSHKCLQMTELTASAPDLSTEWPCRPGIAYPTRATNVALDLSGMQPWSSRDWIEFNSSQACLFNAFAWQFPPGPPLGATSFAGLTGWFDALPDATKGDVVFLSQRFHGTLGGGAATFVVATQPVRLTDFSLADGGTASLTRTLSPPTTGAFRLDLRWSQFARLAADVYPTATPGPSALSEMAAIPPNARSRNFGAAGLAYVSTTNGATDDVDYGTLAYGQIPEPGWRELRKLEYDYRVSIAVPGSAPIVRTLTFFGYTFSPGLATVPVLSPPKAPQINGMDAFVQRAGVGLQPVLSWSKPAIGTPTSYRVLIEEIPADGTLPFLGATIRSRTSFKVPPNFLKTGSRYIATITAFLAGGDTSDRLQFDADWNTAPCITAVFSP